MPEFVIRNDDVSVDLDMPNFVQFCEICDKHNVKIIQCLTPLGATLQVDSRMTNDEIVALGGNRLLTDNKPLYMYLLHRVNEKGDKIAIHGLWHTHRPTIDEIITARNILNGWGFFPDYFFNYIFLLCLLSLVLLSSFTQVALLWQFSLDHF